MNNKTEDRLRKAIDRSGFPFQLKLENVISDLQNWVIEGREIYWEIEGYSGFIDTVYGSNLINKKIVTEAKKTSGGEWAFLVDKNSKSEAHTSISLIASIDNWEHKTSINWQESTTEHFTVRSAFCILIGQNEDNPMLERLCTNLLMATEAFAIRDLKEREVRGKIQENRHYIPVIITNTPLYICMYDSDEVDLVSGLLTEKPEFKKVDSVAFQKPFWSSIDTQMINNHTSRFRYNKAQDRTVFIVNSEGFSKFLKDIDPYS